MNVILANAELQKEFIGYVMQKTSTAFLFIANLDIFFYGMTDTLKSG